VQILQRERQIPSTIPDGLFGKKGRGTRTERPAGAFRQILASLGLAQFALTYLARIIAQAKILACSRAYCAN
jgi:hypothetical protein